MFDELIPKVAPVVSLVALNANVPIRINISPVSQSLRKASSLYFHSFGAPTLHSTKKLVIALANVCSHVSEASKRYCQPHTPGLRSAHGCVSCKDA